MVAGRCGGLVGSGAGGREQPCRSAGDWAAPLDDVGCRRGSHYESAYSPQFKTGEEADPSWMRCCRAEVVMPPAGGRPDAPRVRKRAVLRLQVRERVVAVVLDIHVEREKESTRPEWVSAGDSDAETLSHKLPEHEVHHRRLIGGAVNASSSSWNLAIGRQHSKTSPGVSQCLLMHGGTSSRRLLDMRLVRPRGHHQRSPRWADVTWSRGPRTSTSSARASQSRTSPTTNTSSPCSRRCGSGSLLFSFATRAETALYVQSLLRPSASVSSGTPMRVSGGAVQSRSRQVAGSSVGRGMISIERASASEQARASPTALAGSVAPSGAVAHQRASSAGVTGSPPHPRGANEFLLSRLKRASADELCEVLVAPDGRRLQHLSLTRCKTECIHRPLAATRFHHASPFKIAYY